MIFTVDCVVVVLSDSVCVAAVDVLVETGAIDESVESMSGRGMRVDW